MIKDIISLALIGIFLVAICIDAYLIINSLLLIPGDKKIDNLALNGEEIQRKKNLKVKLAREIKVFFLLLAIILAIVLLLF